jgi:hypothetical protein
VNRFRKRRQHFRNLLTVHWHHQEIVCVTRGKLVDRHPCHGAPFRDQIFKDHSVRPHVGKPGATSEKLYVMSSFVQSRAVERSLYARVVDQNSQSPVLITSTPYRPHPPWVWEPTRRTVFAAGTQPSITRILGCALRSACFTRRQADRSPGRASKSRYSWGFISRIGMVPPVPRPVWPPSGLLRRTRPILSSSSSTQDCGQAPPHSCDRCHTSE